MTPAEHPIIVIRRGPEPVPTVAAVAAAEGWPIVPSEPLGALLRRLFHDRPQVAVVEIDTSARPLLRTLRERRPEVAMLAVSDDQPALELLAITAGAHAWVPVTAPAALVAGTAASLRRSSAPHPHSHRLPLARATA